MGTLCVKEIYMQKKIPNEDKNETLGSLENSSSGLKATWLPASFFSPMTTPMSTSDTLVGSWGLSTQVQHLPLARPCL